MDSGSNLHVVHGLVSLARCLAVRLADPSTRDIVDVLPIGLPNWIQKQNCFRASLKGLDAEYIVDERGAHRPLLDVTRDLIDFCESVAPDIGESKGLEIARSLLADTPGYQAQINAYRTANSARSVVEMLQQTLAKASAHQ